MGQTGKGMSLLDKAGLESAQEIHRMADEAMDKADKLLQRADYVLNKATVSLNALAHGIIDRFECEFHFKIKPPHAKAANPAPD